MKLSKKNAIKRMLLYLAKYSGYYNYLHGNKPKEENNSPDEEDKYYVIAFSDKEDMHNARMELGDEVISFYELEDESYIVVDRFDLQNVLDKYDGRYLVEEEIPDFTAKTHVEGKYVYFSELQDVIKFLSFCERTFGEQKIRIGEKDDEYYLSFEELEGKIKNTLINISQEFLGQLVTDMYEDKCLDYLFYG